MEAKDNIELRSEKVRNIIGQVPPRIIRTGISVFACIFVLLGLVAWFYRFPNKLEVGAYLWDDGDSIRYSINIPVHKIDRIKNNQEVTFNFTGNNPIEIVKFKSKIHSFNPEVIINKSGIYNVVSGTIKKKEIQIVDTVEVKAVIVGNEVNLVEWLFIN